MMRTWLHGWNVLTALILAAVSLLNGSWAPLPAAPAPRENAALSAVSETALGASYDENTLYYLDLSVYLDGRSGVCSADYYDIALLTGVLQGLVNRDGPHFYVRFSSANDADRVWFERLTSADYWRNTLGREPRFLAGRDIVTLAGPADALYLFRDFYKGFAVWDDGVPATSNAALTACGCDGLLPLRYSARADSLYANLTNLRGGGLFNYDGLFAKKPVLVNLYDKFKTDAAFVFGTGGEYKSTGSRKCDAALWAVRNYLAAGKTNPHLMAYHVDAYYPVKSAAGETEYPMNHLRDTAFLLNNDYYIANKAFFFDLNTMKNEIPSDDPDQAGRKINPLKGSADYRTLQTVLKAQNERAAAYPYEPVACGGFTAWHIKYTNYVNAPGAEKLSEPVAVEWQTVREFSYYNVMLDADAPALVAMSDASVFMHYPRAESYAQACGQTPAADDGGKYNYVMFYMGDYDSAAWLSSQTLAYWDNAERGSLPLAWSFAPGLYDRAPHVIDYMYATQTTNDFFVAGDNGAGYLNPEALAVSRNFGSLEQWTQYNAGIFKKFDMDFQGFLIFDRGVAGPYSALLRHTVYRAYSSFAPKGLLTNNARGAKGAGGMPISGMADCAGAADITARLDPNPAENGSRFTAFRVILKSPETVNDWLAEIRAASPDCRVKVVDPYTFMALYAQANG